MKTLLAAVLSDSSNDSLSSSRLSDRLPNQLSGARAHPAGSKLPFGRRSTDLVECPKCGKRSIVARSQNTFDCLNCNFHRELPPVARQFAGQAKHQARHQANHQAGHLNSLMSSGPYPSGAYRSPLELTDVEPESETSQPLLFAAIAVIFGILLL